MEVRDTSIGRSPWYEESKAQAKETFLIGVGGGTASGKTSVCDKIVKSLNIPWVQVITIDSFYRVLSDEELALAISEKYNFDHPDSIDWPLAIQSIKDIKKRIGNKYSTI